MRDNNLCWYYLVAGDRYTLYHSILQLRRICMILDVNSIDEEWTHYDNIDWQFTIMTVSVIASWNLIILITIIHQYQQQHYHLRVKVYEAELGRWISCWKRWDSAPCRTLNHVVTTTTWIVWITARRSQFSSASLSSSPPNSSSATQSVAGCLLTFRRTPTMTMPTGTKIPRLTVDVKKTFSCASFPRGPGARSHKYFQNIKKLFRVKNICAHIIFNGLLFGWTLCILRLLTFKYILRHFNTLCYFMPHFSL